MITGALRCPGGSALLYCLCGCGGELRPAEIDVGRSRYGACAVECTVSFAKGTTPDYRAGCLGLRSRIGQSVALNLRAMGVQVKAAGRAGDPRHRCCAEGGTVDGCNDHRIVMAFSVAGAYAWKANSAHS